MIAEMNFEDERLTPLSHRDRVTMKRDATMREQAEGLSMKNN